MSIIACVTEEDINCLTLTYSPGNTGTSNKIILREQRKKNGKRLTLDIYI